jgi:hypothetical protein
VKHFGWVILAALSACAAPSQQAPGDNVTVVWQKVADPHAACQKLDGNRKQVFAIQGCSKWSDSSNGKRVCTVYTRAPKNEMDTQAFATLGHEVMHCFDGNWHDRWGRMNPPEGQAAAGGSAKNN